MHEARDINWLAELRGSRGLTQEELAQAIGVDQGTLSRWEHGRQRIRSRNRAALAAALDVPIHELNALADARIRPTPAAPTIMLPIWQRAPMLTAVDSLAATIDGCRGLDHSIGPAAALNLVNAQLDLAAGLVRATTSDNDRRRALGLVAELHQLTGWMHFDMCDLRAARTQFRHARTAAVEADNPALLAYITGPSAAFAEIDNGRAADALEPAYAAQAWAQRSGNRRLLAFTLAIAARAHAKLGDDLACGRLLDQAADELAAHDGWDTDPVWLQVFDQTALIGHAGSCNLDLGRAEGAVALLGEHTAASPELFVRNRAIWTLDRAAGYRTLNEVEEACAEVGIAIDLLGTTTSARTRRKLATLTRTLTKAGGKNPAVVDLIDRVAILNTATARTGR